MNIGFDAKRFFFNTSGLGNYSRNIVAALSKYKSRNNYFLFTPSIKTSNIYPINENTKIISPKRFIDKQFKAYWRSHSMIKQLESEKIEVFHGLSHELPIGLKKTNIKSVVTIHDLIFLRHPELFSKIDRRIYLNKLKYSCDIANKIIAISNQTKDDIIELLDINPEKIDVIYQGCDDLFYKPISQKNLNHIKIKYRLPDEFLLTVGTIEKRKNALLTLKALKKGNLKIPYFIIGRKTEYLNSLKKYITENNLSKQVTFIHDVPTTDLPALYKLSKAFIYPSIYEGFGIPILEALASQVPVITGNSKCLLEVGGYDTIAINTTSIEEMINALRTVIYNEEKRKIMISSGIIHANSFNTISMSEKLFNIYTNL